MHEKAFILLKIAGLIIGIDVNDKVVKPILINAQKWFDEQLAAAGSAASPSP